MTDPRGSTGRRSGALPVFAASAVLFVGVLGLLGVRAAQGRDPAIGAGQGAAADAQASPQRIVRRIVITRRVIVVRPAPRDDAAPGATTAGSPPVALAEAPAPPTTASAPAPAPAPPPVRSSSS